MPTQPNGDDRHGDARRAIVQRLWNYCNVLRDDGVSYGDYVEQLTYLLFLKMADEQEHELGKASAIPDELGWASLLSLDGDALETHYRRILTELGAGSGLIPVIFRKAQNKIQDPAKLRRLIDLINGETWIGLDMDVKGEIYEGLLEKNAQDVKSGAGQYFPFGKKSSVTFVTDEGEARRESQVIERPDFWTSTSNKQLNFVQHVKTILKINARAAVVVPDNVLFEGGAGETVRKKLLHECDVHTLLRLPTGIFYAQGVKANVLFFDRKPASETPWTKQLWIYDLRTNKDFSLKQKPLTRGDLDDFVACYNPANRHERTPTLTDINPAGRWRCYTYDELIARDKVNLDIFWLRDESLEDSANLPDPDVIAREIVEDLQAALQQFAALAEDLGG